jgi:hypothetical protein
MTVDPCSPHDVVYRLATLHLETEDRDAKKAKLEADQMKSDREFDQLSRLLLAMVEDGTAIMTEAILHDSFTATQVVVSVVDGVVHCQATVSPYSIDPLEPSEAEKALREPRIPDSGSATFTLGDVRISAEAYMMLQDNDEVPVEVVSSDGRKFHLPGGVPRKPIGPEIVP